MKKGIALLLIGILLLGTLTVRAENGVRVEINGEAVVFDVPPQIVQDRTFVPMRAVFEGLNANVLWDDATKTVIAQRGETTVNVTVGTAVLYKNGMPYLLEQAPFIQADRVLIPLRAVAESFNCDVQWDADRRLVSITDAGEPKRKLSAEEIAEKAAPSVFYIKLFDKHEMPDGFASGFFITEDGVAVTNYHVIAESYVADVETADGNFFPITHVLAYDPKLDIAVVRVSKDGMHGDVEAFPALEIADSRSIKVGQRVYAMGNPANHKHTFSDGLVSHTDREMDGRKYFQITVPLSGGSSGGLLADEYGQALGITTASRDDLQNINFAVPIHLLETLDWQNAQEIPFIEFARENERPEFVLDAYLKEVSVGESLEIPFTVSEVGRDNWKVSVDAPAVVQWSTEEAETQPESGQAVLLTVTGLQPGRVTITLSVPYHTGSESFIVWVSEKEE